MQRLFLHVGCPKTGTTFLQSTFWRSMPELQRHGVELPLSGLAHYQLALEVRGRDDLTLGPLRQRDVMQQMRRALAESTAPTILIDNEMLAGANEEQAISLHRMLGEALGNVEIHVVVTARDLSRQVPSDWQQQVRTGQTIPWDHFAKSVRTGQAMTGYFLRGQDPADVARRWRCGLPAERVHIVTVPRSSATRHVLLNRFCSLLGVDAASLNVDAAELNESLGIRETELLRRVNLAVGDHLVDLQEEYGRVGREYLVEQILAPLSSGGRPEMDEGMLTWCNQQTDRAIEQIRLAGYDVVGDLDELRPISVEAGASVSVDDAVIAQVAVASLVHLLEQRLREVEPAERPEARLEG